MQIHRTILCFGDSNTYGAMPTLARSGRHRFARDRRWPGVLARQLGSHWHVVEEGLPSRTTVHSDPIEGAHKNGLAALPTCLESHMPIDLVILMLGTNDLKSRFSVSPGDIADSLETLARFISSSETGPDGLAPKILVISPPPIVEVDWFADMFRDGEEKSKHLGKLIEAMCLRRGIAHLDAASVVDTSAIDGIHLDSDAHRELGMAIAQKCRLIFGSA